MNNKKTWIFFAKDNKNDVHCTKDSTKEEAMEYAINKNLNYEPLIPDDPAITFQVIKS